MELISGPQIRIAFLTLAALEPVRGIDHIVKGEAMAGSWWGALNSIRSLVRGKYDVAR